MTAKNDDVQKASAGPPPTEAPCNDLLEEIGEALVDGVKPDGDPQAALHKLGDIIGIYEGSPLVDKYEDDPDGPLDERQQAVVDKIMAEKESAKGLLGSKGDPAEGKP